ncbi:MAG: peptide deformylase [Phycisphaerae bacterium]
MYQDLTIIHYPDPRLKRLSAPVETFDEDLAALATRMTQLMHEARGVGLAAPQVGINRRLFVMNATGKPEDDKVYVNPELCEAEGDESAEEGCLSLPEINLDVRRNLKLRIRAQDAAGNPIDESAEGFVARIWQHETDHLNGIMLTDRMGPLAKMRYRSKLRELEAAYAKLHPAPTPPKKSLGKPAGTAARARSSSRFGRRR